MAYGGCAYASQGRYPWLSNPIDEPRIRAVPHKIISNTPDIANGAPLAFQQSSLTELTYISNNENVFQRVNQVLAAFK
jgi:hypothetical protein